MNNGNGCFRTSLGNFFRFLARTIDSYRPKPGEVVLELRLQADRERIEFESRLAERLRAAKARHERLHGPGSW